MSAQGRGVAIDRAEPPGWARAHLRPEQFKLNPGLLWILLIYQCRGLSPSRYSVAQRLYIHTLGKELKRANPSIRSLMTDLECSENTVIESIKDLEERGFLLVERHGNGRNTYTLAWPVTDTTSSTKEPPALCGAPTKKGGTCTRRAGRGTETPGVGPCIEHGGKPRKKRDATPESASAPEADGEGSDDPSEPQRLRYEKGSDASPIPQPLKDGEDGHTSTTEAAYLNHCGAIPQPLRRDTSTVEDEYVVSTSGSTSGSKNPSVLAVGEPTDRNAREAVQAPSAQPEDPSSTPAELASAELISMEAGRILRSIPRYADRSVEARFKRAIIAEAEKALQAGFGREAILRYARMVIAAARFKEHQHVPEFREAMRCLERDVELGTACRVCGRPEGPQCCAQQDQAGDTGNADGAGPDPGAPDVGEINPAELEATFDRLGVPPEIREACLAAARSPTGTDG